MNSVGGQGVPMRSVSDLGGGRGWGLGARGHVCRNRGQRPHLKPMAVVFCCHFC